MNVHPAALSDFDALISLAGEVEHLFGPMAEEEAFHNALKSAISDGLVYCIRDNGGDSPALGGIVISKTANEILWFAVSAHRQNRGYGRTLLAFALGRLDSRRDIRVQTFDASVPDGIPARRLYMNSGFSDHEEGGPNPAGIPTVIMRLPGTRG